jgi:tryptophan synthase alpha chain
LSERSKGVSPLAATFQRLRASQRRAFIPYVTAGDPALGPTLDVLEMLVDAGADVVEMGLPFSDPLADGPTIQAAAWRALARGVDSRQVLAWTKEFTRHRSIPVVLFTYLNPILRYGPERFVDAARESGAAGLLITDLPVGEDLPLERTLSAGGVDLVRLVAPTTPPERVRRILDSAQGFVYYISRTGVTGERERLRRGLAVELEALRRQTDLPIGFGVSTPEQARAVASLADGVVVGSALVRALAEEGLDAARELAEAIRSAIDAATT